MLRESPEIWTVAQLTRRVKTLLESQIGAVWVCGEISNWKLAASGHAYFTLKDAESEIAAVMFRGRLNGLKFAPESGLEVVAHGQVTVYERRGNYQIVLDDMQPKGLGALQLAFEQLKKKLEAEGLFDPRHKKPLPLLPRRIGVVTSPTGAAIRDILNVLQRRFGNIHVILYPARVQGEGAAAQIVAGIRTLDAWGVDVMIVGRGGGSMEDLWCFNEEAVVRAVFAARTPVISAVGHEIDFTLTDFAADLRAPTPSAAAEIVVQEQQALLEKVRILERRLGHSQSQRVERFRHRLNVVRNSFAFRRPEELLRQRRQQYDELRMRLESGMLEVVEAGGLRVDRAGRALGLLSPVNRVRQALERFTGLRQRLAQGAYSTAERARGRLRPLVAQLDALSPLAILSRGYALAWKLPERALIRSARDLAAGDDIWLRFGAGGAAATVKQIKDTIDGATEERS
jgi:exodeoxyribonuclease VII large subunit